MKHTDPSTSAGATSPTPARTKAVFWLLGTALAWLVMAPGADAEPIYRCGSTYSQTPCPQGKIVEATDVRTAAQRAEARRVAANERRQADEMERDRLTHLPHRAAPGASSLSGSDTKPPRPSADARAAKKSHPKKPKAPGDFIAVDPSGRKTRAGG